MKPLIIFYLFEVIFLFDHKQSLKETHQVKLIKPIFLCHKICDRNSKLCFSIWAMQYFHNQQILINNFKPCPYLFDWFRRYKHRMLLIESFIWINTHFIYYDEPLFPSTKDLWLFEYFTVNEWVFYDWLWYSRNTFVKLIKFEPH